MSSANTGNRVPYLSKVCMTSVNVEDVNGMPESINLAGLFATLII